MFEYLNYAYDVFWDETMWLPPNKTWKDVDPHSDSGVKHANPQDLLYTIPMAFCLLAARYFFKKYILSPFGLYLGLQPKRPKKVESNCLLESVYKRSSQRDVRCLARELKWPERKVEIWFRKRTIEDKPTILDKFVDDVWRCCYYTFAFSYGLIVLWGKPWFKDINECWKNYPHQDITDDIWWYYMFSTTFYGALTLSQFFDPKKKDFWAMFSHHIITMVLLSLSWICNFTRIGSLVLIVHDCSDIFLDAARACCHAGFRQMARILFNIFSVIWFITRQGLLPFWIIKNIAFEAPKENVFPLFYFFLGLLILLAILHLYWSSMIIYVVYMAWRTGLIDKDIRSSSSDQSDKSE